MENPVYPAPIHIPYIPELDSLLESSDQEAIINMLDQNGERRTIGSLNWEKEYPYRPLAAVIAAHSGNALYLDFFVRCNYLRAENYEDQSPVSEDSCVEFFVSPTCDSHYWNFEFNCIGTANASHRYERPKPTRLTPEELARIRRFPSCGTRPFCELEGLFTWNVLVVIPLDLINVRFDGQPIEMKGNFYKCASATSAPHYLSWNPIISPTPDFHRPSDFGSIILDV